MFSRQGSTSTRGEERHDECLPSGRRVSGGPGTSVRKLAQKVDSLTRAVRSLQEKASQRSGSPRSESPRRTALQRQQSARAPGELRDYLNRKRSMSPAPSRRGLKRLWKTVFGPKAGEATQPAEQRNPLPPRAGEGARRASAHQKTQRPSGHDKPERMALGGEEHSGPLAFTDSLTNILRQIRDEEFLRWPKALKNPEGGDQWEYCHYHGSRGHDTEDCTKLRAEIERLVMEGYLDRFLPRPGHGPGAAGSSRSRRSRGKAVMGAD